MLEVFAKASMYDGMPAEEFLVRASAAAKKITMNL